MMFGFSVLTWNSGIDKGTYSASLSNILFGGSSGHAAAELVIPATEENKQLIQALNTKNKLGVKEETTLVTRHIDSPPGYVADEVPCFRIYFSFWGDVKTKKTTEGHRMVDKTRDRLEEGEGIPVQYSDKAREMFGADDSVFTEMKWEGKLGKRKGLMGVNTIFHQTNQGEKVVSQAHQLLERLEEVEQEKEMVLFNVKAISYKLSKLKTDEERQAYLDSKETQEIFERYDVMGYLELQQNLAALSAALTDIRCQLELIGMRFGANPDNIIFFPVSDKSDSNFMMDYQGILKEMAFIANNPVSYHCVRMNCSSAVVNIINAGLNNDTRRALSDAKCSVPSANIFFETPQSAHKLAQQLSSVLLSAEFKVSNPELNVDRSFWAQVQHIFLSIINYIFSEKPEKIIQKALYPTIERKMLIDDLYLLENMYVDSQISEESYTTMEGILKLKIQNLPQEKPTLNQNNFLSYKEPPIDIEVSAPSKRPVG